MTFREIFGPYTGAAALLIGLTLGWIWRWEQRRKRRFKGMPVDTNDPLWTAALAKARASLPRFRELATTQPSRALVKFALTTTTGAIEHVWGPVLTLQEDCVTAGLETPPVEGRAAKGPPFTLRFEEIEDWTVELDDGRIYGAYTARAQIEYARKLGLEIPGHMQEIEKCLVDA